MKVRNGLSAITVIAAIGLLASPAAAKSIWDEITESSPRSAWEQLNEAAPRSIFDEIRETAPVLAPSRNDGAHDGE